MRKRYCLLTNDVETTSILNNRLSDKTGEKVLKEGLPILLELYAKYGVTTTFFFTGYIAEKFPGVVRMILPYGHEVGSHGYLHNIEQAFDVLSLKEQMNYLIRSKQILEDISGHEVVSFRAPASRVNKYTATALMKTGFKIDCSIASQRFDMFLSFGNLKKLHWIMAPRVPYFSNSNKLWKEGNGKIFVIPISAILFPYIGTTLRILPRFTRLVRCFLHFETSHSNKPIVFLIHPNEFIDDEPEHKKKLRRAKNYFSYIMGDLLRHKLKLNNLGKRAIPLYEKEIQFFSDHNYKFVTCRDYYDIYLKGR